MQWHRRRLRMRTWIDVPLGVGWTRQAGFRDAGCELNQYIANGRGVLDWKILLLTIPRVLTCHGAS